MLLHGLFGSLENLSMIKREAEKHRPVLSVDLPDHGSSPHTNGFSFAGYAESVQQVIEDLSLKSVILLGHSLGGKIAMQMALNEPERVTKLIVADIAPVAYSPRHQAVLAGLRSVDLSSVEKRGDADDAMSEHIKEPGVRQFLLKSLHQENGDWRWRFNLDVLERDYSALSQAIKSNHIYTGPVLFIKGGNSDYLLPEHKTAIDALFPNSQARIIQDAGHWLHAEKPAMFNRIVERFIENS